MPVGMRVSLVIGFLLAVAATVLLVIAEDVRLLRLAVVIGLWSALVAAFGLAWFRRDTKIALLRQEDVRHTYEIELQREVSARREFEMSFAEETRTEIQAQHSDELVALRTQIERLTDTLSGLLDGNLLFERLTLSAESTRVRSLGDGRSERADGGRTQMAHQAMMGPARGLPPGAALPGVARPVAGPPPDWVAAARAPYDPAAGAVTEQIPRIVVRPDGVATAGGQRIQEEGAEVPGTDVAAEPTEPTDAGSGVLDGDVIADAAVKFWPAGGGREVAAAAVPGPPSVELDGPVMEPDQPAVAPGTAADRPDAPAAEWARRRRGQPKPQPSSEPSSGLQPVSGPPSAPQPEPEPEMQPLPAPEPEPRTQSQPESESDSTTAAELDEPDGEHRKGVSVLELLAAYRDRGEVGRHRRRRSAD